MALPLHWPRFNGIEALIRLTRQTGRRREATQRRESILRVQTLLLQLSCALLLRGCEVSAPHEHGNLCIETSMLSLQPLDPHCQLFRHTAAHLSPF